MADAMASRIILASASSARQAMLKGAGVVFEVVPAQIDESALRAAYLAVEAGAGAAAIAAMLAAAKAEHVSRRHPDALVIGSDQVLECDGRLYEKPSDLSQAAASLRALRGREHRLVSAVAVAIAGANIWSTNDEARLRMRPFSDAFLDQYLSTADGVCASVGAYRLEGPGIQLFEAITGDYFTILGMPLLPLLTALRQRGVLTT